MAKKDPQPPRNGKTDKPPVPPPFQRLTTPAKWVAPMSAAPPSFRRQKVDVVRAPQARTNEPTPQEPDRQPPPRVAPSAPEVEPVAHPEEPVAPAPPPVEPASTVQESPPEPAPVVQEPTPTEPEPIAGVEAATPEAPASESRATDATQEIPEIEHPPLDVEAEPPSAPSPLNDAPPIEPKVIRPDRSSQPYMRPAPQIGPEFVPTDANAARPARRKLPRYPALARTRQVLTIFCAVVFLALAVWAMGLWLHSLGVIDRALFESSSGTSHWAESYEGAIYFHEESVPASARRAESLWRLEMGDRFSRFDPPSQINGAATHGFTRATVTLPRTGASVEYAVISYWLIVLGLIVPGVLGVWSFRRLRARCRQFRCPNCRADLRGSPYRCPACGMPGPLVEAAS